MPDFSELYANMIKRSRAKTFEAKEAVYGGDNEYIPVRYDVRAVPPEKGLRFTLLDGDTAHCIVPLEFACRAKRGDPTVSVSPNRPLTGYDFADFGDRKLLAELGYFSVDLPKHRAKRDREAQREAYLDQAYDVLHLDRKAVHAMIAAKLEATRFDGIWARSTGEYSEACRKVDMTILARSPAIAQSIQELGQ